MCLQNHLKGFWGLNLAFHNFQALTTKAIRNKQNITGVTFQETFSWFASVKVVTENTCVNDVLIVSSVYISKKTMFSINSLLNKVALYLK